MSLTIDGIDTGDHKAVKEHVAVLRDRFARGRGEISGLVLTGYDDRPSGIVLLEGESEQKYEARRAALVALDAVWHDMRKWESIARAHDEGAR